MSVCLQCSIAGMSPWQPPQRLCTSLTVKSSVRRVKANFAERPRFDPSDGFEVAEQRPEVWTSLPVTYEDILN